MRIAKPFDIGEDLYVDIWTTHTGHVPGSDEDAYFLPIHPLARKYCSKYLSNSNDVHAAWGTVDKEQNL